MTSAIDSTLTATMSRLLPVSMVDTPSIMKLVSPPPPMRAVPLTPGANVASVAKLRLASGRLVTDSVAIVKERSPLCDCIKGDSPRTSTVCSSVPTSRVSDGTSIRSPGLTATPARLMVLKPSRATLTV